MKFFERRRLINGLLVDSAPLNLSMIGDLSPSGGLLRVSIRLDLIDVPSERARFPSRTRPTR